VKDRILLIVVGIATAAIVGYLSSLEGKYSPFISEAFAVIGVIALLKRR